MYQNIELLTLQDDAKQIQWISTPLPEKLMKNQILMKIEKMALTANNITYVSFCG